MRRSNGNTAAILTRAGTNPSNAEELISIDIGNPMSDKVKESAESLANKFGGKVLRLSYEVDGAEAYRVSIAPNYDSVMPRDCIVMHHKKKVCFLFGGSKSKSDIWPTVEAIAGSWTWD